MEIKRRENTRLREHFSHQTEAAKNWRPVPLENLEVSEGRGIILLS
jgi:hypothetical protein